MARLWACRWRADDGQEHAGLGPGVAPSNGEGHPKTTPGSTHASSAVQSGALITGISTRIVALPPVLKNEDDSEDHEEQRSRITRAHQSKVRALKEVIGGRREGFVKVAGLEQIAFICGVSPYPGQAVSLQLDAH